MPWKHRLLSALLLTVSASAGEGDYRLYPHPDGPCQGAGCVPLILIHGIHGSSESGPCGLDASTVTDCNWGPMFHYLAQRHPSVWRQLRVYVFRYLADRDDSVIEMGRQLRLLTDREREGWHQPAILVGQSMGGLVARAFLADWPHPMLPRGLHLASVAITLATPHHGTPLANRILRNRLAEENTGTQDARLDLYDFFYWSWNSSPHLVSNAGAPNRADLLWDGYDGLFDGLRQEAALAAIEENETLNELRSFPGDGMKLIVYGGFDLEYCGPRTLACRVRAHADTVLNPPREMSGPADPSAQQNDFVDQLLVLAGRLLRVQLGKPWNDGFVPLESALFAGNPGVVARRVFAGYDHRDMMGYHSRVEGGVDLQAELLEQLALDIAAALPAGSR